MKKIFVYGSLMLGLDTDGNMNGAKLVHADCRTLHKYAMYIYEDYPFIFEGRSNYQIKGELYEVPADVLKHLDAYEGDFYFRKLAEIECGEETVSAFVYFGRGHFFGMKEVKGGDYRAFRGKDGN